MVATEDPMVAMVATEDAPMAAMADTEDAPMADTEDAMVATADTGEHHRNRQHGFDIFMSSIVSSLSMRSDLTFIPMCECLRNFLSLKTTLFFFFIIIKS